MQQRRARCRTSADQPLAVFTRYEERCVEEPLPPLAPLRKLAVPAFGPVWIAGQPSLGKDDQLGAITRGLGNRVAGTLHAAGVSAGIDMALTLVSRLADRETAERIQLIIEYDPQPPFDTGSPAKAPPQMVAALREEFGKLISS